MASSWVGSYQEAATSLVGRVVWASMSLGVSCPDG